MLFSEPKIPQFGSRQRLRFVSVGCFSALQRAENSSIVNRLPDVHYLVQFQCSSASRKFLNRNRVTVQVRSISCFSALQRAENSSIETGSNRFPRYRQRFSALQRAENSSIEQREAKERERAEVSVLFSEPKIPQWEQHRQPVRRDCGCFSALQRAENSSIKCAAVPLDQPISFQCSSASRKFLNRRPARRCTNRASVSVLFSEPKIPQ